MTLVEIGRDVLGAGLQSEQITAPQMAVRAILIYVALLVIVRFGKKRFMSRATPFDVIVGIVLGSIASRAVTGNAPLVSALVACAVIMALHWLFSAAAVRWHGFGVAIKGKPRLLIRDGAIDRKALRDVHMSDNDLAEALRSLGLEGPDAVAKGRLERDGRLSVIRHSPDEPGEAEARASRR